MCLAQGHNTETLVRLEPAAPQSRVKHSTTEPLCSLKMLVRIANRGDPDRTASEEAVIWVSIVLSMDSGTIVFKILKYFNTLLSV